MLRRTARDAARVLGFPAAINADRNSAPDGGFWTTSAYGIARGLQIVDGVAYRDFQTGTSQDEAFVMMRDGTHRQAYIADGKTAQQWVDEGALWTVGGFAFLVIDGVAQDVSADVSIEEISARTIFGRKANGDFVIITVEGATGSYGIGGQDMVDLAVSEGMDTAIVLDGGGSTQCWWGNAYAHPSSDSTGDPFADALDGGRKVGGWLCIDVPSVDEYVSGIIPITAAAGLSAGAISNVPAIWLEQIGPDVHVNFNVAPASALAANADALLTGENIPARYFGRGASALRGLAFAQTGTSGFAAWALPILGSGAGALTARVGTAANPAPSTVSSIYGRYSWRARWS